MIVKCLFVRFMFLHFNRGVVDSSSTRGDGNSVTLVLQDFFIKKKWQENNRGVIIQAKGAV